MSHDDLLLQAVPSCDGFIGQVILNRPKALNALSLSMCEQLGDQLLAWQEDPTLSFVLIKSVGDRAFSAGGDIKKLYEQRHEGADHLMPFFWHEYRLNLIIHAFQKPYIALMQGMTMGGGAGISVHGSHRIATPDFTFAMPETKIGFFPDIGSADFLHRCPGHVGLYLALTGNSIDAQAALELGLITHLIAHDDLMTIENAFARQPSIADINAILKTAMITPAPSELHAHYDTINACFSADSVEKIIERLTQQNAWANTVANTLKQRSPTSLKVTFEHYHRSQQQSFHDIMQADFDIAQQFLSQPDFFEGIRAAVVDKDRRPIWQPSTLQNVTRDDIQLYFCHKGTRLHAD